MANDTDLERVWGLIDRIGFCMLASRDGNDIRSRPMSAQVRPADNAIYFLTDVNNHKDDEIKSYPEICLAFADAGDQKYVSLSGRAEISNDRALIEELWSIPAKAWWDGPDDPSIRVLKFTPKDAQYWDSPGTVASYISMVAAAFTDARPAVGKQAKVRM